MPSPRKVKWAEQAMQHCLIVRWLAAESYIREKYCDGVANASNGVWPLIKAGIPAQASTSYSIVCLIAQPPARAYVGHSESLR